MLTVEDYARIRLAKRDGMSIRAIARQFHHSRRKIREVLQHPEPRGYTRSEAPTAPKLGPFFKRIDEILLADEEAPRKQRHTAAQIFRRIVKEGYAGGYDQVRRYVASRRRMVRETFLPLDHQPGQRAECDFGHIYVDFPDGRHRVAVLLVTWAYSYRSFAIALPTERVEAILHGMRLALEFFDCVPKEVWWDNPKTVAVAILTGRQRKIHPRYLALASHYNFEPLFCMPRRGNEKPHVENRVKNLQRRWATPVPRMKDLAELNAYLRRCCDEDSRRLASGQKETIGRRFDEERLLAVPLPKHGFEACIREARKVDKYQTVAFDNNRYSVPRRFAFQTATVKGGVDTVEIVVDGVVVARHERSYGARQHILDPLHYLTILGRKPAYLDHTSVFKNWTLPAVFGKLRRRMEARHGPFAGARQFARVLQLLGTHPVARVTGAIESCRDDRCLTADLIVQRTERLRLRERHAPTGSPQASREEGSLPSVDVPSPDLKCFDNFLQTGGLNDVQSQRSLAVVESQPQATATAHDAGGV